MCRDHIVIPYDESTGHVKSFSNHEHVMDEVTQRVNNIDLGAHIQAGKSVSTCAEIVIQEALSHENDGDQAAALKLVQAAIEEEIQPLLKLKQYAFDWQQM